MSEKCYECSCPFAFTDESEQIQNYGCLPEPMEIVNMRIHHGKTWACHSDTENPCIGAIKYLHSKGMPYKIIDKDLISEKSNWQEFAS